MTAPLISCQGVHYSYKRWGEEGEKALDGIDFVVEPGSVTALIGPNGAGKSTLLNIMLGLHPPSQGEVKVMGHVPWHARERLTGVATFVSDVASLPRWITVRQLGKMMERVHARFDHGNYLKLLDRVGLPLGKECGSFSKGQLAYIHLALALSVDASLLILDEPTLGLDVAARRLFHNQLLADYCRGGRSLVITTHYPDELGGLVTHAAFLQHGRMVLASHVDELAERFLVAKVQHADAERAGALGAKYSQPVLGGMQMLFDLQEMNGAGRADLERITPEIAGATLSDVYLALVAEPDVLRIS